MTQTDSSTSTNARPSPSAMAAMIPTDDTPGALEAGTAWETGLQVTDRTMRPLLVV